MSETPMNKLRALCEKWKREVYDYNPVACAAQLEAILPDVERLEQALRDVDEWLYRIRGTCFSGAASPSVMSSDIVKPALALFDQPVAPKETK